MKIAKLALLLAVVGCHHDKTAATTTTPVPTAETPAAAPAAQPAPEVTRDQQVSPTLAMAGELVKLCGIQVPQSAASPSFDYDKDDLAEGDRHVLEQLATCMTTGPLQGKAVRLIGRADPRGTQEYNLALGSRRAETVSQYLQHLGVANVQLVGTTRGALDASGTDAAGWAKDRRVDLQLAS
jgi:peptidoglycan-associated lipoprotein